MRGYHPGAPRVRCECGAKSRNGEWVDWYGNIKYLCEKCLRVAQKVLAEAAKKGEDVESNLPVGESKKYAGSSLVESTAGRDRGVHNQTSGYGPKGV